MDKEILCPWCKENATPNVQLIDRENGKVRERRCTKCGKVLAAYLVGESDFMTRMRTFEN
ncbi:MAG: hypothetical protein SVR08_05625 [Spirochaetota bacterium]|nr:hypothetical protein [Spirochaetota bacterium]